MLDVLNFDRKSQEKIGKTILKCWLPGALLFLIFGIVGKEPFYVLPFIATVGGSMIGVLCFVIYLIYSSLRIFFKGTSTFITVVICGITFGLLTFIVEFFTDLFRPYFGTVILNVFLFSIAICFPILGVYLSRDYIRRIVNR